MDQDISKEEIVELVKALWISNGEVAFLVAQNAYRKAPLPAEAKSIIKEISKLMSILQEDAFAHGAIAAIEFFNSAGPKVENPQEPSIQ